MFRQHIAGWTKNLAVILLIHCQLPNPYALGDKRKHVLVMEKRTPNCLSVTWSSTVNKSCTLYLVYLHIASDATAMGSRSANKSSKGHRTLRQKKSR